MLPDFGKQFGDAHFLFQHDCAPLHKSRYLKIWTNVFVMEELGRLACMVSSPQPKRNTFGMN